MDVSDIQTLYAYNRWANKRLLSALEELSDRQFTMVVQSSFPSIRETIFHILFAEWLWLKRWQGTSPRSPLADPDVLPATWSTLTPGGMPTVKQLSTLAALKSFAEAVEQERQEFLRELKEDVLRARLPFSDMAGAPYSEPLMQLMQHLVNHGTYHRGQVTTMLRQLGVATVPLDMLYFFREAGEKAMGEAESQGFLWRPRLPSNSTVNTRPWWFEATGLATSFSRIGFLVASPRFIPANAWLILPGL